MTCAGLYKAHDAGQGLLQQLLTSVQRWGCCWGCCWAIGGVCLLRCVVCLGPVLS